MFRSIIIDQEIKFWFARVIGGSRKLNFGWVAVAARLAVTTWFWIGGLSIMRINSVVWLGLLSYDGGCWHIDESQTGFVGLSRIMIGGICFIRICININGNRTRLD